MIITLLVLKIVPFHRSSLLALWCEKKIFIVSKANKTRAGAPIIDLVLAGSWASCGALHLLPVLIKKANGKHFSNFGFNVNIKLKYYLISLKD